MIENTFTSIPDMIDVVMPWLRYFKALCTNKWYTKENIAVRITYPSLPSSTALCWVANWEYIAFIENYSSGSVSKWGQRRAGPYEDDEGATRFGR